MVLVLFCGLFVLGFGYRYLMKFLLFFVLLVFMILMNRCWLFGLVKFDMFLLLRLDLIGCIMIIGFELLIEI